MYSDDGSGFGPELPLAPSFWVASTGCGSALRPGQIMTNVWAASAPVGSLTSIQASTTLYVLARGIPIMWQASDTAVLDWWATAGAGLAATTPSASTTQAPPGGRPTDAGTPPKTGGGGDSTASNGGAGGGGGLPVGAQVGVGVAAAVIAIALAIYFFLRLRKLKRALEARPGQTTWNPGPHEMEHKQVPAEASTLDNTHQMWTQDNVHELHGTSRT